MKTRILSLLFAIILVMTMAVGAVPNPVTIADTAKEFLDVFDETDVVLSEDGEETDTETGTETDTEEETEYVAEIGDTQYVSLLDAVNNANGGETVRLICDIDISTNDKGTVYYMPDNSTLDLNGFTITSLSERAIFAGKNITIKNGTFTASTGYNEYPIYFGDNSETPAETKATLRGVEVSNGGVYVLSGAKLVIEDTAIHPNVEGKSYVVISDSGAEITILSGKFTGSTQGVFQQSSAGKITLYGGMYDRYARLSTYMAEYNVANSIRVESGTRVYKYEIVPVYVAETGGVNYPTLQAAIDAAEVGGTVTLLGDLTFNEANMPNGYDVVINKSLTLNLDEHYIRNTIESDTLVDGVPYNAAALRIYAETESIDVIITATSGGITTSSDRYAIEVGKFENSELLTNVTISYGSFLGGDACISQANGTLSITGGLYVGKNGLDLLAGDGTTVLLSGGTYANPVDQSHVAEGYVIHNNDDGTYRVGEPFCPVAEVGGVLYESLLEAVNNAYEGDTITLIDNISLIDDAEGTVYHMPDNSVLDLNGYTLAIRYARALFAGKDITIKNGYVTIPTGYKADYLLYIGNVYNSGDEPIETNVTLCDLTVENGGVYVLPGAKLTIDNCVIHPRAVSASSYVVVSSEGSEVSILSGRFKGCTNGLFEKSSAGKISLYGGNYDRSARLSTYVAEHYKVAYSLVIIDGVHQYTYTILPVYVAENGENSYLTFEDAIEDANYGDAVNIVKEIEITEDELKAVFEKSLIVTKSADFIIDLPDYYEWVDEVTLIESDIVYIARLVGGRKYADLQKAVDAAGSGGTINLIKDVTYSEANKPDGYDVTINKSLTLNLGEYYIRNTIEGDALVEGVLYNAAALRICADDASIDVVINATTGGITTSSTRYAVDVGNVTDTELVSNVTINGGSYLGGDSCINLNNGTVNITDGRFEATSTEYAKQYTLKSDDNGVFTISGGTFVGFNPADNSSMGENSNCCAEGYGAYDNGDGTYTVKLGIVPVTRTDVHAIRASKPAGLRFKAEISAENEAVEIGWIVTTAPKLSAAGLSYSDFKLDSDVTKVTGVNYSELNGTNKLYTVDNSTDGFCAVLIGFGSKDYDTIVVARPYITDSMGTWYGEAYAMSLRQVAEIWKNDGTYDTLRQSYKNVIDAIINGDEIE